MAMGLRGGIRVSRGTWISGGSGFAATLLTLRLLELGAMILLALATAVATIVIAMAITIWQSSDTARRKLARQSLADGVDPAVVRVERGRSDPPVWGVYLIGRDVYTGSHPKRQDTLARLYPDRPGLLCAALMPDARLANAAARQLRRHGFSASELTRLFPMTSTATAAGAATVLPAAPERTEQPMTKATTGDDSHAREEHTKMKTERDLTKYQFDGQVLGKGRLVWAVVRRYVTDHPGASFEELRQAFPDELQASSALQFSPVRVVVARLSDIPEPEAKRFFLADGEKLVLRDSAVAVSREWNLDNIQVFLARAKDLGYEIAVAS